MSARYLLAPQAAEDLIEIWRFIKTQTSLEMADRVESVIRERIAFLARNPSAVHWRKDLTNKYVRFLSVFSYLILYRPETKPLQIVSIIHGRRDVEKILGKRL